MTGKKKVFYLKKVYLILGREERIEHFEGLMEKLAYAGIACKALPPGGVCGVCEESESGAVLIKDACGEGAVQLPAGVLCITDEEEVLNKLISRGFPVAAYLHEENASQNLAAAKYAFEQPEELDVEYLERVYRRYASLPWDILETERCILRESAPEDVDAFFEIYKEPGITQYTDGLYAYKSSERAALQEYIEKVYSYYEFGIWTVVLKETGEIIGRAGLNIREGYELPELGYVIGLPWQGMGLATEVCEAILAYAEKELGMDEIQVLIHRENAASLGLAKKLGFVQKEDNRERKKEYVFLTRKG